MTERPAFSTFSFPAVPGGVILCAGLLLDTDAPLPAVFLRHVTESERARAARFLREEDALRHLAGRALVRRVLQAALGQDAIGDFPPTPLGKPRYPGADMHFSISHSGGMVWAAFCRAAPVGIDVEESRPLPDLERLAASLHPEEAASLRRLPPEERTRAFYRCWTRKEAVLKADGSGLSVSLDSFQVRTDAARANWIVSLPATFLPPQKPPRQSERHTRDKGEPVASPATWTARDIPAMPGYHCGVAACAPHLAVSTVILEGI